MSANNITVITYGSYKTDPLYQYDYGQIIHFNGFSLPTVFEVHFANEGDVDSTTAIGTDGACEIPNRYLTGGNPIIVWLFLHVGNTDGETIYEFEIPVIRRADPESLDPTPEQQDAITQAIAALNSGVARAEAAADNAEAFEADALASKNAAAASEDNALTYAERAEAAEEAAAGHAEDAQEAEGAAQQYAAAAAESAAEAATSADRAEQAATTAGYMDIGIDGEGHLIYVRTDAVDVDFSLSQYGHLVMEAIA